MLNVVSKRIQASSRDVVLEETHMKKNIDEIDGLVYRLKISRVTLPNNAINSKDVLLKRNNQS